MRNKWMILNPVEHRKWEMTAGIVGKYVVGARPGLNDLVIGWRCGLCEVKLDPANPMPAIGEYAPNFVLCDRCWVQCRFPDPIPDPCDCIGCRKPNIGLNESQKRVFRIPDGPSANNGQHLSGASGRDPG